VNADGIPIRPAKGMDDELTHKYAANISQLAAKARSVIRDLDPQVSTPTTHTQSKHASSSHRQDRSERRGSTKQAAEAIEREASSTNFQQCQYTVALLGHLCFSPRMIPTSPERSCSRRLSQLEELPQRMHWCK
jgi:hypothetical protein